MSLNAGQKLAVVALPVAAFGLAFVTSEPGWSPPRARYGSLREKMEAAKATPPAPAAAPAAALPPAAKPGEAPAPKGEPGAKMEPAAKKEPAAKAAPAVGEAKPPAKKPAKTAEKAPAEPEGVEFRVTGLATARFCETLRIPAADRLDVHVLVGGSYRVGADLADPDTAKEAVRGGDERKKAAGLLYLVPNAKAPWDSVRDIAAAGFESGWSRVALCVAGPDDPGRGRVLPLVAPTNETSGMEKGLDALVVKVVGAGPAPSFTVNAEACKDEAALKATVKGLHEEYEVMSEGYSKDPDVTAWTLDGTGASAAGVVTALDALAAAGVKSVRILGLRRAAK